MQRIVSQHLYSMSGLTYTGIQYEPTGQAAGMDAWRGENASILQAGQASGMVFDEAATKGRESLVATFAANVIDRP